MSKAESKSDTEIAISERAREYRVRQYNERIVRAKSYFDSIDVELAFKSGATIFSTENAQLRDILDHISEVAIGQLSSIIIHDDLSGKDISLKKLIDREKYTEPDIVACSEWS